MKKISKSIMFILTGAMFGAGVTGKVFYEKNKAERKNAERYLALFQLMDQWIKVKQEGKCLTEYFQKHGYNRIAVYGMGRVGSALINELGVTDITVVYGIDRRADSLYADIDIFSVDDTLPEVDAVVVTAVTFYDEIEEQLSEKMNCPIISFEDILSDI